MVTIFFLINKSANHLFRLLSKETTDPYGNNRYCTGTGMTHAYTNTLKEPVFCHIGPHAASFSFDRLEVLEYDLLGQ